MPPDVRIALGLVLASLVAYLTTPVVVRVARRFEFYDHPAGGYKIHATPTPYLGGAAILAALVAVTPLLAFGDRRFGVLLGGACVLWLVGTIDDRRPLSPLLRVCAEGAVGLALYASGEHWHLGLGAVLDATVTVAWIVGVVNAFNLIDNMDGVASVLALAAAATIAALAWLGGDTWLTVAGVAMAGACLGFLPHNLVRPSRIFLGDGGSMLLGFVCAAMTVMVAGGAGSLGQSLAVGLMVVALPVSDMTVRIVARHRRGISPLIGGRDSVTHHARALLPSARAVAFTLGGLQALIAGVAIAASQAGPWSVLAPVVTFVALLGAGITFLRDEAPAGVDAATESRARALVLHAPSLASSLVLGLLVAGAPFAGGYYGSELWAPAGLAATGLLVAAVVARPAPLAPLAALALGSAVALAGWASLSVTWADAAGRAIVDGNRLVVYAVLLALLILSIRSTRAAAWHVGFVAAAVAGIAIVELTEILSGSAASMFLSGRLHEPLGYINGLGSFFLLGFWPLLALAEQRRSAVVAGLGIGGAYLAAVLMLLSQSRGVALGAVLSVIVVMVAVPGRVRRAIALGLVVVCTAAIASHAGDLYRSGLDGAIDTDLAVELAGRALLIAALAGIAWGIAVARVGRVVPVQTRRAAIAGLCLIALGVGGVGASQAASVARTLERQYHAFVSLSPGAEGEPTASRLVSGVGYRYDYWRVAVDSIADHPVAGVGAGNYSTAYFRERATAEDIRQPHSLSLQTLSELGIVGGGLLLTLGIAVLLGGLRVIRRARSDYTERLLAVAGVGSVAAWVVHTNVDWIHLLPGVTLIALIGAALLLRPDSAVVTGGGLASRRSWPRGRVIAASLALAVGLLLASATLAGQTASETYQRKAQRIVRANPPKALSYAERALRLNPELVRAYYTQGAAHARLGDADASTSALLEGLSKDPDNFVTLALLGDLSVRRGDLAAAKAWYMRAHLRNPLDAGLAQLARDPTWALRSP